MIYRRFCSRPGALAGLVLAVALTACKGRNASSQVEPDRGAAAPATSASAGHPIEVELAAEALAAAKLAVEPALLADRASTITAAGAIEFVPSRVARIGPRVPGRVSSLKVEPGSKVAAGAVLAIIESVDVARARADLLDATAHGAQADKELARQLTMSDAGVTSERELADARTRAEITRVEIRAAEERLRGFGGGASQAGATTSGGATLTTPLAGTVMSVDARVGQSVGASDTLFVVGDLDEVWLIVDVHERYLSRVREGDDAKVTTIAIPDRTFDGKIAHVAGLVDPQTKAVRARIVLANHDRALKPGMSASARIVHAGAAPEKVVVVPRVAVQAVDGLPFVFVEKAPGKYEMRPVEKGLAIDGRVEIVRGVAAGERVVGDGSFLLKSEALRDQMGKND